MQSTQQHILLVAGRSGGHIIPALTLAKEFKKENPETAIDFIATGSKLDKEILSKEPVINRVTHLGVDKVPARFYKLPFFFCSLVAAWVQCIWLLIRKRPQKIVLMGGYISIPVCLAGFVLRIPRELYELNAVPGKATKLLAPFSSRIFLCFVQAKRFFNQKKSVVVPYPIRFTGAIRDLSPEEARHKLTLAPHKKTILVLGGSQGSLFINNAFKNSIIASAGTTNSLQVIHQTGSTDITDWQSWYRQRGIQALVFGYHHDLSLHYQAADIVISRAGAGSIFEILFFQKKAIIIPLETNINDHQVHNALAIQQTHGNLVTILRQPDIEKNKQLLTVTMQLGDSKQL